MLKQSAALLFAAIAVLLFHSELASAGFFTAARFVPRPNPITDEMGRIQYIVDFAPSTYDAFSDSASPEVEQRFQPWKSNRSKNFARSFELQYDVAVDGVISYIGPSVWGYFTLEEMERISQDPRVILITESSSTALKFSAPPWANSSPVSPPDPENYGMRSWGHVAVNGLTSTVGSGYTKIYVVDTGVAYHNDLTNITRVNPFGGGISVVGCYAHGTQVASIINATAGNTGTVGILPGVPIVSVSVNRYNWGSSPTFCGDPGSPPAQDLSDVLDWVYFDIRNNNQQKPGIVNLSMNGPDMGHTETVGAKIKQLATNTVGSGFVYFGAFIAQSAGNNNGDACTYAYNDTNTADGVMVVGGVDNTGEDVTGSGAYVSDWTNAENGSNYGSCVEVWAPSKEIYGSWGTKANPLQSWNSATWTLDDASSPYASAAKSGGTSFAAPHVAAIAAQLQKTGAIGTGALIETAVRGTLYHASKTDQASNTIYYPTL